MNLAIRGISGNLGDVAENTFFRDQHKDLKADFIMANPPFNQKQWAVYLRTERASIVFVIISQERDKMCRCIC